MLKFFKYILSMARRDNNAKPIHNDVLKYLTDTIRYINTEGDKVEEYSIKRRVNTILILNSKNILELLNYLIYVNNAIQTKDYILKAPDWVLGNIEYSNVRVDDYFINSKNDFMDIKEGVYRLKITLESIHSKLSADGITETRVNYYNGKLKRAVAEALLVITQLGLK